MTSSQPNPQFSDGAFLNTGIPLLNDLLTRDIERGIALPTEGGFASSTTVIKGAAGAGKSVLTSIISYNIHRQHLKGDQGRPYLPIVIYFSYAQPAKGIYRYLDEILPMQDDHYLPIILSPKYSVGIQDLGGISALRRSLISTLAPFRILPFSPFPIKESISANSKGDVSAGHHAEIKRRFEQCINHLTESDNWQIGRKLEDLRLDALTHNLDELPENLQLVPVVVIDPINFFFDYRDSRSAVSELFSTFRTLQWPLILTLEDVGDASLEEHRQLTSYVEFEADLVIELTVCSEPHIRRSIEVTKSRNMQPRFGRQMYRIEKPEHAFSNMLTTDDAHPGFMIFPSIHWVLSKSYERDDTPGWRYRSGIAELDKVLNKKTQSSEPDRFLPPDASILVRGEKGGHKLPLSFNILVRGLGETEGEDGSGTVMLICLGEETYMTIPDIPLACDVSPDQCNVQLNNGTSIVFDSKPEEAQLAKQSKVMCHRWCARRPVPKGNASEILGRLIEVTFKPGYLTPEEFLWVVDSLVKQHKPKRVMIDNTAHLRMRFPDLFNERMLFPALSCMAKKKEHPFMLIVTDVTGKGSWEELSYGLAAGADVVIEVEPITKDEYSENDGLRTMLTQSGQIAIGLSSNDKAPIESEQSAAKFASNGKAPIWSKISVSNVRGKQYERKRHAVTVLPVSRESEDKPIPRMFMVDITEATTPSIHGASKKAVKFHIDKDGHLLGAYETA